VEIANIKNLIVTPMYC